MSKGESSGESPLLDEPGRKPGVRERRFAQVFKDVTNTLESDVESLLDESSEGDWFATEGGTPQPGIELPAPCAEDDEWTPTFPMIEAGPVDMHRPDGKARVQVAGRSQPLEQRLVAFLLTRSAMETLLLAFAVWLGAIVVFAAAYLADGIHGTNVRLPVARPP